MRRCYRCGGVGWVSSGAVVDGRTSGRETCVVCNGSGKVTVEQILAKLAELINSPEVKE